jgi:hypothetical protein
LTINDQLTVIEVSPADRSVLDGNDGGAFDGTRLARGVTVGAEVTSNLRRVGLAAVLVAMIFLSNRAGSPPR